MASTKKKANKFIGMWSREGLECIIDLSKWEQEHEEWSKKAAWAILKEDQFRDIEPKLPLQMMILRARVNSHRFYEIYSFTSDPGITQQDIEHLFEINPQYIVDLIRKNGSVIYSDREKVNRQVIA